MNKIILTLELVPASSFFSNVRSHVSKKQWDILRKQVYSAAYDVCEICGGTGNKHPVECHEVWSYDDKTNIQKLVRMIALCPNCHTVKHFGLARIQGKEKQALSHFMKVNEVTKSEAEKYIQQAFDIWFKRSQEKWTLDLEYLKDFGINTDKL